MTKRFNEDMISTYLSVPDDILDLSVHKNVRRMSHDIRANLESSIANSLCEKTFSGICGMVGTDETTLILLLKFLLEDPEIYSRFVAYRAAKRILD